MYYREPNFGSFLENHIVYEQIRMLLQRQFQPIVKYKPVVVYERETVDLELATWEIFPKFSANKRQGP